MSSIQIRFAPIKKFERNLGSGHFYTSASKEKRVTKNGVWGHGIAHCVAVSSCSFTVETVYESRHMSLSMAILNEKIRLLVAALVTPTSSKPGQTHG